MPYAAAAGIVEPTSRQLTKTAALLGPQRVDASIGRQRKASQKSSNGSGSKGSDTRAMMGT